jgi:hypothetical protein
VGDWSRTLRDERDRVSTEFVRTQVKGAFAPHEWPAITWNVACAAVTGTFSAPLSLTLSPDANRGLSGEGAALTVLATSGQIGYDAQSRRHALRAPTRRRSSAGRRRRAPAAMPRRRALCRC